MKDAWTKGSRLHQDISVNNIVLVAEDGHSGPRKGYLIDWDDSCEVDASGASSETGRVVSYCIASQYVYTLSPIAATGHLGVHVLCSGGAWWNEPQTHNTGRHGVAHLRCPVLCVSLVAPPTLSRPTGVDDRDVLRVPPAHG